MKTPFRIACAAILLAAGTAHAQQDAQGHSMTSAPIVFFDIAGPDLASQRSFYKEVFGWESQPNGGVSVPTGASPLMGLLRTDPAEKVIYFGVPDVTASLEKVVANGGKVHAPRFEVPGVVVLGLFTDPAGNRLGLVEIGPDGKAKIP
jgi:uncharacterized protein